MLIKRDVPEACCWERAAPPCNVGRPFPDEHNSGSRVRSVPRRKALFIGLYQLRAVYDVFRTLHRICCRICCAYITISGPPSQAKAPQSCLFQIRLLDHPADLRIFISPNLHIPRQRCVQTRPFRSIRPAVPCVASCQLDPWLLSLPGKSFLPGYVRSLTSWISCLSWLC